MKKQLSTFTIIVISIFGTCAVCTAGIVATTPESERGASAEPTSQVRPAADMAPKTSPVAQNADLEENKIRAQQARDPITVEDVKSMIKSNEARLTRDTKGKIVAVSGVVDRIGENLLGGYYIIIREPDDPVALTGTVRCQPSPQNSNQALDLNAGEPIVVTGIGDGVIVGSLVLDDCRWGWAP